MGVVQCVLEEQFAEIEQRIVDAIGHFYPEISFRIEGKIAHLSSITLAPDALARVFKVVAVNEMLMERARPTRDLVLRQLLQ